MKLAIAALGWLSVLASPVWAQAEGEPLDLEGLLQPEVVLATKRAQGIWEAPAVIDVIGRADLRRRGYRSVAEALRFLPGFQISDDYLMPSVSVRGIHNGQRAWSRMLKVMLDGQAVPFRPEASNWLGPEFLPLELIERIEIIRGPGSALYGADAFLGVVNVVTRRAEEIAGSYLTGKAGTWLNHPQAEVSMIAGYPTPWNSEWVAAAQWSRFDRSGLTPHPLSPALAGLEDPVTRRDDSSPLSLYVRAAAQETAIGQWRADALLQHLDTSGEFYDTRPLTHATRLAAENRHLRGHWRQDWTPNWSTQLALSHADAGPASHDRVSLGRTDYDLIRRFRAVGWDVALDTTYLLDERDFVSLGADFNLTDQELPTYYRAYAATHPRAGEWELMGDPGDAHRFLNLGVFGQGVLHPWDATSLTVGLRHDWHNIYGGVFNARAALVNQCSDNLSGKLLYGSSFKAPSPQQLFGRPLVYGDILGNPDLKPERAQTLEAAVDFLPLRGWSLHANTYLTHVSDALRFVAQAGNPKAVNEAQIIAGGLEASTRLQQGDWLMETNLAVQRASVEEAVPTFTANLALGAPLDPVPFTLYAECRVTGSLPSTQSNYVANGHVAYRLPASAIADVTLSSRDLALLGGETTLTLKVENLLDSSYATPGFGGLDYPGRGRHVWLGITQGF